MPDLDRADFFWHECFWKATVCLPDWGGFQSRRGPSATKDLSPSDGTIEIVFAPEGRDDSPLKESEIDLVRWAVRNSAEMQRSLLDALLAAYPSLQEKYEGLAEPDEIPSIHSVDDLRSLIGLHSVTVHQIENGEVPYVGFEFGCTWDSEHGLGVLMHGTRVVEIGGADTAILLWIAKDDAGVER